jgi:hypothetical protein
MGETTNYATRYCKMTVSTVSHSAAHDGPTYIMPLDHAGTGDRNCKAPRSLTGSKPMSRT